MAILQALTRLDPSLLGAALVMVLLFLLRGRWREDVALRRRTNALAGVVAVFIILRAWLEALPRTVERLATIPATGELTRIEVANPVFQTVSVTSLIIGFLGLLLLTTLLLVELLMVRRMRFEIPRILPDVASTTVFFFGVLFILYHGTDLDITAVFTTSAVLSVVIGLAVQDTLGNLFSGLALQTERAFQVGDWVRMGEHEGAITDVTWRSTKIRTRDNDLIVIPNSMIAKNAFLNYSAPSRAHVVSATVGCHYRHPPGDVSAALAEAASQTEGIAAGPPPRIRVLGYEDSAVKYQIRYWIDDYASHPEIRSSLMIRIWYVFARRGIEIPYPMRNVFTREMTGAARDDVEQGDARRVVSRLRRCDLFESLGDEELGALAKGVRAKLFFSGETVLHEGDEGDSLYVIDEGRVEVLVQRDGRQDRVAELAPPSFFGEMSLMTGEPRSGTVRALEPCRFFVVERSALEPILRQNPEVAERISRVLSQRQSELHAFAAARMTGEAEAPDDRMQQILSRVRQIFRF
jgi:small-conductance mechanosensitive channel/CRP-like cAMP-binding protein